MSFTYLEKVVIDTDDNEYQEINHKVAVIISRPEINDNEEVFVLYFIDTDDDTWTVPTKYLKSTGEFEDEKNIYDGTAIHVVIDKEGKGKIVDS
jgi:hypothetical protein